MTDNVYRVLGILEMSEKTKDAMVACGVTSGTMQRALWMICVAEAYNDVEMHMDKGVTANG